MRLFFWGFIMVMLSSIFEGLGPAFVLPVNAIGYVVMIIGSRKVCGICDSFNKVTISTVIMGTLSLILNGISLGIMLNTDEFIQNVVNSLEKGHFEIVVYIMIFAILKVLIMYYMFYMISKGITEIEYEKQASIGASQLNSRSNNIIKMAMYILISTAVALLGIMFGGILLKITVTAFAIVFSVCGIMGFIHMLIFLGELNSVCGSYELWKIVSLNKNSLRVIDVY